MSAIAVGHVLRRCVRLALAAMVVGVTCYLPQPLVTTTSPARAATPPASGGWLAGHQYDPNPGSLTRTPDGSIWSTEWNHLRIGRLFPSGTIKEYPLPAAVSPATGIVRGPDGAMWFTERAGHSVNRITAAGQVTRYPQISASAHDICGLALSDGGALWMVQRGSRQVARFAPNGAVTHFGTDHSGKLEFDNPVGSAWLSPQGPAGARGGGLWAVSTQDNVIMHVTPAGTYSEWTLPTAHADPFGMTAAPDGALWYTEWGVGAIVRRAPDGSSRTYALPNARSGPAGITWGPDGNLWYTEMLSNRIGRMTPTGTVTEYSVPVRDAQPLAITAGKDGNLWFGTIPPTLWGSPTTTLG